MRWSRFSRSVLIAVFAATPLFAGSGVSAAIPCEPLVVISAPTNMPIPMIYIELPLKVTDVFARGQAADRTSATPASQADQSFVESAVMNQIRCLTYGNSVAFMGNATPSYRVLTTARPNPEADLTYIEDQTVHLIQFGDSLQLEDGRFLIDFSAIVDGETFIGGEMVFVQHGKYLYLDGSALRAIEEIGTIHTVQVSERFTREIQIVRIEPGDAVTFENTSEESTARIAITDPDGETVFSGSAMGESMVGGENENVFVAHDLAPGDYVATISYFETDVELSITIQIGD